MPSAPRLSGGERQISRAGRGSSSPIPPHRLPFHPLLSGRGAGAPVPWLINVCKMLSAPAPSTCTAHGAGRAPQPALDTTLETQVLQEPAKLLVSSLFMDLADGTTSWSGRGKRSARLQLCTQPQETPLGSNKHRNKRAEGALGKERVPRKQTAVFPSPPSRGGGWGSVWGTAQVSPHTDPVAGPCPVPAAASRDAASPSEGPWGICGVGSAEPPDQTLR